MMINADGEDVIRRLERLGEIQPAAADTARALQRVRRALEAAEPTIRVSRGRSRWRRFAVAAAVFAGLCSLLTWFSLSPFSLSPAAAQASFGKVQAAMRARQSVACRQSQQSIAGEVETDRGKASADKADISRWAMFGDGRLRVEMPGGYTVIDGAKQRFLQVDARAKEATLFEDGTAPIESLYDVIKNLPQDIAARPLPRTEIDGKAAIGFEVEVEGRRLTVWADSAVQLPVRIESESRSAEGLMTRVTIDEFVYDKKLDAQLFSLDPPKSFAFARIGKGDLHGRWERTIDGSNPLLQAVLTVEGDRDIYVLQRVEGGLVRKITSRVRLEQVGDVLIYNREGLELVEGNQPPGGLPQTQSFIYKFDERGLCEVSGLLHDRTASWPRPAVIRWNGPGKRQGLQLPVSVANEKSAAAADDPALQHDFEQIQGRWERIGRNAKKEMTLRQERVITGDIESLTTWFPDGTIAIKQTARFRLERFGPVRVFHVFERTEELGPSAGLSFEVDYSSVYRIDKQTLLDTPGLFRSRPSYQDVPTVYQWTRPETLRRDDVAPSDKKPK